MRVQNESSPARLLSDKRIGFLQDCGKITLHCWRMAEGQGGGKRRGWAHDRPKQPKRGRAELKQEDRVAAAADHAVRA